MVASSARLMVLCQLALGITQKDMANMLGVDRRTIQRWQDKGTSLLPATAETLAKALRPEHPELADQVLALGGATAATLGLAPAASPEVIDGILQAAAEAGGASPGGIRAAVTAAFGKAVEAGVEAQAVVAGLMAGSGGAKP